MKPGGVSRSQQGSTSSSSGCKSTMFDRPDLGFMRHAATWDGPSMAGRSKCSPLMTASERSAATDESRRHTLRPSQDHYALWYTRPLSRIRDEHGGPGSPEHEQSGSSPLIQPSACPEQC